MTPGSGIHFTAYNTSNSRTPDLGIRELLVFYLRSLLKAQTIHFTA